MSVIQTVFDALPAIRRILARLFDSDVPLSKPAAASGNAAQRGKPGPAAGTQSTPADSQSQSSRPTSAPSAPRPEASHPDPRSAKHPGASAASSSAGSSTGSRSRAPNAVAMEASAVKPRHDPDLNRNVVEVDRDGAVYRIPARLGADGRYEVTGILSVGGFGVIYLGRDQRLFGKPVLIKAIRYSRRHLRVPNNRAVLKDVEEQRKRLNHERKMLLSGYRRGIGGMPILLDVVEDLGLDLYGPHADDQGGLHHYSLDDQWRHEPYLILSYVDGTPMGKVLGDPFFANNRLGNTKQVILQVGRMLAAFHREEERNGKRFSFIYQDLKPDNIIFTREKQPVLIDFGGFAVRIDGVTKKDFARTGTPGYQPPEFLDDFPVDRLDPRADVFSLGMTVYHILGGVAPKADPQGNAVRDPAVMQGFPAPWRDWIERATQMDRERRFADMKQAIELSYDLPLRVVN